MDWQYPYQNLSLKNIKGEIWKPVPDFEDYYEISSFGRVKSLKRERIMHHGGLMPLPEKIMRPHLGIKENKTIKAPLFTLMVTLSKYGIHYSFSIGRLVYYVFVASFDLSNRDILISYRDGDGRNLHYENLVSTDISKLNIQSFEKRRFRINLRKPVSQFDTNGKLIAQYASIYEAGKLTSFRCRVIAKVATGSGIVYKGFVWQLGHGVRLKKQKLLAKNVPGINSDAESTLKSKPDVPLAAVNTSLENMPGERWKDFPGYEGLYKVSNFGRVKGLSKVSEGKTQHWYPDRILRLSEANRKTLPAGKKGSLVTTLCKDHKKKGQSVARHVYYLFVEKFDLTNQSFRVYYKDGNPYNLHCKNLILQNAVWSIARTKG